MNYESHLRSYRVHHRRFLSNLRGTVKIFAQIPLSLSSYPPIAVASEVYHDRLLFSRVLNSIVLDMGSTLIKDALFYAGFDKAVIMFFVTFI